MTTLTETEIEQAVLEWLSTIGWQVSHGSDQALGALTRKPVWR